ncbi:A24 family peptidase [Paraliobacillus sp. JSM ZJ581]|uniref:prepilin peptidase n=1 Tax=Paraliobacillus sp. JSM ZJ581 TaxID=3342118 RepID=UPI0035A8D416
MELIITIILFIFGSVFGSFFNVVGLRIPTKKFLESERSYCPRCGKNLSWYELLPIISFIRQGGKCRGCKTSISLIYPVIELFTASLFALSYYLIGFKIELLMALLLVSICAIIIVSDIKYMLIPNKILLFFSPFILFMRILSPLDPWWSPIVGSLIGFIMIFLIIISSKGGMGAGDMKLFALLGLIVGYQGVLLTFFIATLIGTVVSVILLIRKKVDRKSPIPFGPFICVAACITYFFGQDMLNWYMTSFF